MRLKSFFLISTVVLDVAFFPFSCSNDRKANKFVIFSYGFIEADTSCNYSRFIYELPKDNIIEFPTEDIATTCDGYEIDFWYMVYDEEKKPITFPYTYTEDDIVPYFEGIRSSVVFIASWKAVE